MIFHQYFDHAPINNPFIILIDKNYFNSGRPHIKDIKVVRKVVEKSFIGRRR